MNTNENPDREAAIRALIDQTVNAMGETSPDALPHRVRQRLADQVDGDVDFDRLLQEVLRERGERSSRD